ncbi:M48 family metallopeptidase [Alteromonas ponticola]|uniref:M48 family metallopeptidase n=1 Tax=Alteromonas ponticola TaxID=2720613 RepID=A0ABX1QYC2_9ALTE|nr:M48 family metallopeptidase [Alteromonas ponticola]NMH59239.1 M48 family metallopeptidase [Alteromonas ponticola]
MTKWIKRAGVVSLVTMLGACGTSPTGRNQLLLFPEEQMAQMGQQAFTSMKEELKVSSKRVANSYVECVARSITVHVPQDVFTGQWEVVVFDDEQVNAFALPGGKIGVYTGLLNVAKNQHQLAAVIGHEIGHVIAHHGNERMSIGTASNLTTQVVGQVLAANEVAYSGPIMAAIGLGAQVGVQLPYSRSHESEADLIGLTLMAQAGFNPQESVALWHNMDAASEGNRPPEMLSTHPAPDTRIQNLQANMAEANALYQQAPRRPDCK